jgi:hypothetical protein
VNDCHALAWVQSYNDNGRRETIVVTSIVGMEELITSMYHD